ncbi:caspase family protein [Streptomyces sp. NPDC059349]|uniref:caspase family protein n=1 Tax=Streptomyces sp. NPDC059349 TaxID=3346808 RepID=UPI0036795045
MTEAGGRRFLIAAAVGTFRDPGIRELPGAAEDVRRVRDLLEPMGYEAVLTDLAVDPTKSDLAEGIEDWTHEAALGPEDVVVVYFAGHGISEDDRRHYLLCTDAKAGRIARALAAEDLARPLVMSPVGHLLVMLDTCYAAAGTNDISRLASDLANIHRERANRWHLASAHARGLAKENVFVDALVDVFTHPLHGATQQYVSVREVTERVNAYFQAHRPSQQARLTTAETDGQDPFFPSPRYLPDLPADGIDLASLAQLRRRHAGHFGPRSRGLEHVGELGDYFTGRAPALSELTRFLTARDADHDRKARIITGDPGSGKSALLGRLLALTDPDTPYGSPALPHIITLHARRASLTDLVTDLADALQLPSPVDRDAVLAAASTRTEPIAVLLDSLDEAGTAGDAQESRRIAHELLQPLSTLPAVRLIVGTRRPQIPSLGHAIRVLDLDTSEHITRADLTAYAHAVLEDAQDPDSRSPYRDAPESAATIAEGIAARAGSSYLVARMTARALVHGQITVDTSLPGWREQLPSDAREAFAAYLDRFGTDRPKVERLLRPLAYAQGAGLPWSTLWAPLAEALSGVPCSQDDLDWLHHHAGAYIVETPTPWGSSYRLFHETMAEHLRRRGNMSADHATIARTLTSLVPLDPATNVNNWPAVHPYIRHHLATHAAAGAVLDGLLEDAEYLVHAEPAGLLRGLDTVTDPAKRIIANIYLMSAAAHTELPTASRRDVLAIDAARYQQPELAAQFARTRPWRPRWATGSLAHPAHRATLTGHTGGVNAVSVTEIDGRPHAITSDGRATHTWDLTTGTKHAPLSTFGMRTGTVTEIGGAPYDITGSSGTVQVRDLTTGTARPTLTGHTQEISAMAVGDIKGHPYAVTGGHDRKVRIWDLTTGRERATLTGHTAAVSTVALADIDGRPHAVTGGYDRAVRVWDLTTGRERATLTGHTNLVNSVTVVHIDGRPHAIAADIGAIHVWDLTTNTKRAVLTGHTGGVHAVAVTEIDGRPHAVTGGYDRTVRVWDLTAGTERATLTGHTGRVNSVAVADVNNRPHAITGSDDGTARVWDLTAGTERTARTGHTNLVNAVTATVINNHPHAISGGKDGTVRIWDLTTGTERATLTGYSLGVNAVAAVEIDGRPHAITSDDEAVRVWDLATGTKRATLSGHIGGLNAVAAAEIDGSAHAITGGDNGRAPVWDLTTGAKRATLIATEVKAVAAVEIDGRPHAIMGGSGVQVWDLTTGTKRSTLIHRGGWVRAVAAAEINGHPYAITGGDDGMVQVWDLATGSKLATLTRRSVGVNAAALAEINGRTHAITGGADGTVQVWDLLSRQEVASLSLPLPVQAVSAYGDLIILGMAAEVVVLQRAHRPGRGVL